MRTRVSKSSFRRIVPPLTIYHLLAVIIVMYRLFYNNFLSLEIFTQKQISGVLPYVSYCDSLKFVSKVNCGLFIFCKMKPGLFFFLQNKTYLLLSHGKCNTQLHGLNLMQGRISRKVLARSQAQT